MEQIVRDLLNVLEGSPFEAESAPTIHGSRGQDRSCSQLHGQVKATCGRFLVSYGGAAASIGAFGWRSAMGMEGRVVIITGATGGLGRVAAAEFVNQGARLVLVSTSKSKLTDLAAYLGKPEDEILVHPADLTRPEAAGEIAEVTSREFGRIDVLLHLIGGWIGGKDIEDLEVRDVEVMLQQHLWSSLYLAKAVVPYMRKRHWGRILVISSPTASQPVARRAPYAIGKAAQEALIQTLAQELKATGVTANLLLVNTIDVARQRKQRPEAANANWSTPEEITATLLHLCKDEAAIINGARIPLFGG